MRSGGGACDMIKQGQFGHNVAGGTRHFKEKLGRFCREREAALMCDGLQAGVQSLLSVNQLSIIISSPILKLLPFAFCARKSIIDLPLTPGSSI